MEIIQKLEITVRKNDVDANEIINYISKFVFDGEIYEDMFEIEDNTISCIEDSGDFYCTIDEVKEFAKKMASTFPNAYFNIKGLNMSDIKFKYLIEYKNNTLTMKESEWYYDPYKIENYEKYVSLCEEHEIGKRFGKILSKEEWEKENVKSNIWYFEPGCYATNKNLEEINREVEI